MNRIEIIQLDQEELKGLVKEVLREEIPTLTEELIKPMEEDILQIPVKESHLLRLKVNH